MAVPEGINSPATFCPSRDVVWHLATAGGTDKTRLDIA
jgi:hypothetical protein